MIAYAAIIGARFRMALQYRSAALAGFFTQLFWGLIRCMIFEAFYHSTTRPQMMTLSQAITYVWLSQAMFALLPWQVDNDVRAMVQSGTVAYEMLRPVDVYGFWFCRALAARTAPTLLRAAPMFVAAGLFFGLKPPPTPACAVAWTVAMLAAVLMTSAFTNLLNISLLWTLAGDGVTRLAPSVVLFFSGMLLPLAFFPTWSQPIVDALPFRDMVDVPFRIYMGHYPPADWPMLFVQEALWIIALVICGRMLLARGLRRLVVQGG
jgi:ABC-2 type transport system permease protein